MSRGSRLILEDVCYHVITRGNEKRITFHDDNDYEKYLKLLLRYKSKYRFRLYGWCLMNNHVHMLLDSASLSKAMHGISLSYAKYFKHRYESVGHFWQDRFKSYVIQKDKYLINCITYIEYNPVRANIVSRPEDYKWSSYKARILGKGSKLLDPLEF
ncbi:MAG: transposase [Candidatus Omnitrophica bacterium]|nr:transposase [Candidatus Omnitrophota bacterium]